MDDDDDVLTRCPTGKLQEVARGAVVTPAPPPPTPTPPAPAPPADDTDVKNLCIATLVLVAIILVMLAGNVWRGAKNAPMATGGRPHGKSGFAPLRI